MSTESMHTDEFLDRALGEEYDAVVSAARGESGGGASTSGRVTRSRSGRGPSRRRGRPRRAAQPVQEAEDVDADEIAAWVEAEQQRQEEEARGRPDYPRGPGLREDFAQGWEPSQLVLAPECHLSQRVIRGWPRGNLRTFSGFTSVFDAFDVLSVRSRQFLLGCAFAPLIRAWAVISEKKVKANLMLLRAFLDRYWDTTTTFHMPGYEAGVTLLGFAVITGLPCGEEALVFDRPLERFDSPGVVQAIGSGVIVKRQESRGSLVNTCYIQDYFRGEGRYHYSAGDDEQNARLWLWWFFAALHFGEKGERATTLLLLYLMDWGSMDRYDWVILALGLTIKYCRDVVRPDHLDQGSKPSLVFPGLIMESWVLSHFPSLLPRGFVAPRTFPAVHAWGTGNRKKLRFDYDEVRRELNSMTYEQFAPKPWGRYTGVPT
ncbi:hypothetical protein RND81_02G189800 [Saponaria officinalis]|uniref:Aminotransferase-like plant mobile domain-containing protein n=1 Tax=Saponaria officinalis TaxID=3572 RepID=A0AAW1MMQ9_SAPOF